MRLFVQRTISNTNALFLRSELNANLHGPCSRLGRCYFALATQLPNCGKRFLFVIPSAARDLLLESLSTVLKVGVR